MPEGGEAPLEPEPARALPSRGLPPPAGRRPRPRSRSRAGLGLGLGLCALPAAATDEAYPAKTWSPPPPADADAWSAARLKAADEAAATLRTDAYLVVHRGRLVHSYGDIARPRNVYSVRKSALSVLTGIYVDRGVIDLEQTLAELNVDDVDGLTAPEKAATWRQLLQSKSGVYHRAAYEMREAMLQRPARGSHSPGTFWSARCSRPPTSPRPAAARRSARCAP